MIDRAEIEHDDRDEKRPRPSALSSDMPIGLGEMPGIAQKATFEALIVETPSAPRRQSQSSKQRQTISDPRDFPRELARGVCRALAHLRISRRCSRSRSPMAGAPMCWVWGAMASSSSSRSNRRSPISAPTVNGRNIVTSATASISPLPRAFRASSSPRIAASSSPTASAPPCLREAPAIPLAPARRRAVLLRFAQLGAGRLRRLLDPEIEDPESRG